MSIAATGRKIGSFFWRDFAIARGYRGAVVLETIEALFGVATFFYLSRFVESPQLERPASRRELLCLRAGGLRLLRLPQRGTRRI